VAPILLSELSEFEFMVVRLINNRTSEGEMKRISKGLSLLISFTFLLSISLLASEPQNSLRVTARQDSASKQTAKKNSAQEDPAKQILNKSISVGPVYGDTRSKIFYWSDCPKFGKIKVKNRRIFGDNEEAIKAGFKPAKDCKKKSS
jgi:hypothetical protein